MFQKWNLKSQRFAYFTILTGKSNNDSCSKAEQIFVCKHWLLEDKANINQRNWTFLKNTSLESDCQISNKPVETSIRRSSLRTPSLLQSKTLKQTKIVKIYKWVSFAGKYSIRNKW